MNDDFAPLLAALPVTDCVLSTRRQLELMQQLQELADCRAAAEQTAAERLSAELEATQQQFDSTAAELHDVHSQRRRQLENEYGRAKQTAGSTFESVRQECQQQLDSLREKINRRRADVVAAADHHQSEAKFQALAVFDAGKDQPRLMFEAARQRIQSRARQTDGLERDANTLMAMRAMAGAATKAIETQSHESTSLGLSPTSTAAQTEEAQQSSIATLHDSVLELQAQPISSLFLEGGRPWTWFLPAIVVAAGPAIWLGWGSAFAMLGGAIAGGAALGGVLLAVMRPRGRRQSLEKFLQILGELHQAKALERQALQTARQASEDLAAENIAKRDADVAAADQSHREAVAEIDAWQQHELQRIKAEADQRIDAEARTRDEAVAAAEAKYPKLMEENAAKRAAAEKENKQRSDRRREAAHETHDAAWESMADAWQCGFREVADELAAMGDACNELFPDWSQTPWSAWKRPKEPPAAFRFGACLLPLKAVRNGWPDDVRLQPPTNQLVLPAMMTLDEQPRFVATANGAGRRKAVDVLQLLMLRFLTAMPAGKLRFTIIDAAGLGENFSGFMHLADHDEQLVGGQIWTDPKQINDRLTLLGKHMEKVLQKYLRNEFATIHDYNLSAGEVAEPYHVVVVANFPAGLNEASARKLASISASGPRCGVYVLASVDAQLRMPHEFDLSELLNDAVHLDWAEDRLVWKYPLFERLPLEIDELPHRDLLNDVLRAAGEESHEASRVEVPFAMVAPERNDVWTHDSASELSVPIGRAGAKQFQSMRLGKGTSQHVLISGKTGSGKSTLLHALITNLALHYPPDQLEFYLVDFKKGVEFRAYAAGGLPHARVIAIESEREFGVSVLERLDEELRRRGELFRRHGVQDVAGIRRAAPDSKHPENGVPRTLLIVDEFQELFVADDKLAQDAALLLDRLVRQGRAFGIHVLLGSQTLAGAYSLARSTLGQMAVRIALECSEADAHLILSDENTAARLLSRPGEAIYNDDNGLVAGNHPFQVVWLPDEQRRNYLAELKGRELTPAQTFEPPIVFEGNVPANPLDNSALVDVLDDSAQSVAEPTVWVGSAVRIEPPTNFVLHRQGGQNLAIVGSDEPLALGILTTATAALAAQQGASFRQHGGVRFSVLNGSRPESTDRDVWNQVAAAIGNSVSMFAPREAAAEINRLADECARRHELPDEAHAPHYLIVHDLAQFRDLRQNDDDFGFSFSASGGASGNGKAPPVDRRFRELLKEGPSAGVHVLLWCDSYNSLTRAIDRITLREIEFRVALQMSAADSTSLIDTPAAGLLGEHRAILYRDDLGTQTKFRPYGRPSGEWLARLKTGLLAKRVATT